MMHGLRLLMIAALSLGLTACGGQDTETAPAPAPEEAAPERLAPARAEPADQPPASPDPADEPAAQGEAMARAERERLRQQRGDGEVRWWDDDALAERLGLDPEQRSRLLEAREALLAARLEGRTRLREQRELGTQLDPQSDADRLTELQRSIGGVREQLEQAEFRWEETIRDTLHPEQQRQLDELIEPQP